MTSHKNMLINLINNLTKVSNLNYNDVVVYIPFNVVEISVTLASRY